MPLTYKTFRAECKAAEDDGVIDAFITMSSNTVDRDEEVIEPSAYKKTLPKFMKRPVLLSSHTYNDLRKQIGEFREVQITDKGMKAKPQYYINQGNEEADWAYTLAKKNMAAFSVGFIPKKWDDGDGVKTPRRTYSEVELLEISQVCVPSNREAIQGVRAKSVDPVEIELLDKVLEDIVTKPEETDDFIRIPVSQGHADHEIRTIDIDKEEGISALYCTECKEVATYLFAKDHDWTMESAKEWVKEHEKAFVIVVEPEWTTAAVEPVTSGYVSCGNDTNAASTITTTTADWDDSIVYVYPGATDSATVKSEPLVNEADIQDDMDEIVTWFEQDGKATEDTMTYAWKVVNAILKQAGDDIPEDIRRKVIPIDIAGAVRKAFAEITEITGG